MKLFSWIKNSCFFALVLGALLVTTPPVRAQSCHDQGGQCAWAQGAAGVPSGGVTKCLPGSDAVSATDCGGYDCCIPAGSNTTLVGCLAQGGTCSYAACPAGFNTSGASCGAGVSNVCCIQIAAAPAVGGSGSAGGGSCTGVYGFPDPLCGADIPQIVNRLISAVLGLSGGLFFVYFLWGGFKYMTAGGDSKDVQAAQKTLSNAVIGLVIIALSYAIVTNIINIIAGASSK